MDHAVALVEAYLRVNGFFTVAEYPVVEASRYGGYRTATDLDILAFRFPGGGRLVSTQDRGREHAYAPDPQLGCATDCPEMLIGDVKEGRAELKFKDPVFGFLVMQEKGRRGELNGVGEKYGIHSS